MDAERYFGLYRAVVANDIDPEGRRRLQVRVPHVFGHGTCWAEACVPVGDAVAAPPVESPVWVMFEAGDPARPVWMGAVVGRR